MIIEELIAKLGYKVEKSAELRKFEDGLKRARTALDQLGTAGNKWLNNVRTGSQIGKTTAAVEAGAIAARRYASTLLGVASTATIVAGGIAGVMGGIVKLANAFVRARGEAALLRREMQLDAKGSGSNIASLETLVKGIRAIGGDEAAVNGSVAAIAAKVNEAIQSGDFGDFKLDGIAFLKPDGQRIDAAEVQNSIFEKYASKRLDAQMARRRQRTAETTGDKAGATRESKIANRLEKDVEGFGKRWNIEGRTKGAFDTLQGGAMEYRARMTQVNQNNPGLTRADEDRKKELSTTWKELEARAEGIGNAVARPIESALDAAAISIGKPLNEFLDGIQFNFKKWGLMSETRGEMEARQKRELAEQEAVAGPKKVAEKFADQSSLLAWLFGIGNAKAVGKAKLDNAISGYESAQSNRSMSATPAAFELWSSAMSDFATRAKAAAEHLQALGVEISPKGQADLAARTVSKMEQQKTENNYDQRRDFNNDQRQISVSVSQTINGFAESARAAAAGAVAGAIMSKAGNTPTAGSTTP